MKCTSCGHENPDASRFCNGCGQLLHARCGSCGIENPPGARFCNQCGASLLGSGSRAQGSGIGIAEPRTPNPDPRSYTPKHLAEKILQSKSALEGERKQVTVLFADLKSSMELLADRDPEEARALLDPVLELLMEAVHRYEGTVNQVMGDGIMALFGAPVAHEDHAVRACYAAIRMQQSVRRHADEVRRTDGVNVRIRVGLNSGEVVVRAIGSDLRMDYTAVGQTTHLAARMEQLADPGSILLGPAAFELVEGYVDVKSLGRVPVKGLTDPVEVYELVGVGTARSRLQARAARGLTRFVGRDPELAQLVRALEQVQSGHGQLVAVVGEPGVGKSRLYYQFARSHRTQDWLVLEAGAVSHGQATSYLPVIDLLKGYFKIQDRDAHRDIREKLTGKLLTLDESLRPSLPAFLALLDVPVDDPQWQSLDPSQRRQQTLDAIKRLLLREAQVQPIVVLFEDLHWIDGETQALLDRLVESLPAARVLLLVNYRPEYQHTWSNKTYYTQLRLDALPAESAGELLAALLGSDPAFDPLKALLTERAAGNPLFLEESVRTLVETRLLVGDRGAYRLTQPVHAIQVPATVQAILASRIDRLPLDEKRLLQGAAVIGKDVPFILLQEIAELPEEELRRGLASLQAAEFLYEVSLFPDLEYTFKHALTHDVAYGSLLQERRRALHAGIVTAIERVYTDRLTEHVERLAHHALRGERWEEAFTYLQQAGGKAVARSAYREAVAWLQQALAALARLPETRETLEQAIDLRFRISNSLYAVEDIERGLPYLREAEVLASRLDDQRRLALMSALMTNSLWMTGDSAQARTFGERAVAIGGRLDDPSLTVLGSYHLAQVLFTCGEFEQAEQHFRMVEQSLGTGTGRLRHAGYAGVIARSYLAWILAERGAFDEGISPGQDALHRAEGIDHPFTLVWACWGLAQVYRVRGDADQAIRLLDRGVAVAHTWGLDVFHTFLAWLRGYMYAHSGRVAEGLTVLENALQTRAAMGLGVFNSLIAVHLGEAYMLAGRIEDAQTVAGRALAMARERGERSHEAYALRLLGEIPAHHDPSDIEMADTHYREALALADELGMRPLVARCHLGLGRFHRRTAERESARDHLATAATMLRDMGMRHWLEQAETELKELG